ncbi:unnamed protein product [Mesocestoides corti]|uniref:WD repeat-containing protein on Y chromosome n=1 Tax=Mesocestoides corti TaxID=53468 RepID=A0A0R3UKR6_MESCO|nr:unnamed protein product [Mesocestoides corti]
MSGVHRTYRLRSNSVPSRSRWSTPRPEFTFVLNRPWTPGNKEVDRLGGLCDINILDVLKVEDLEKFRDELEKASENGNFDMAAFRDFMMSWPVKANSWQDGLLTTWTRDLQLLKKSSLKSSLQSQPCGKKWYTDFMYLNDMNKMVATTGDRELEFFELSTCQFYFRINELDTVPMCLSYGKLPNSDQHAIVWGDSNGNVSILLLRDFADLLRRWRTPMHLDVQPTISIAKVVLDEKVKFIRWQTHDEWVAKDTLKDPRLRSGMSPAPSAKEEIPHRARVQVWDLDNQVCLATSSAKGGPQAGELQACAYSPFTRSVLLISDEISLVELMKNESVADEQRRAAHQSWDCHGGCRFGRDLTSRQNTLVGLDQHEAHGSGAVTCMCFDLTDRRLITGGQDGYVRIWNHHTGACIQELRPDSKHEEEFSVSAVGCINIGTVRYIVSVGWGQKIMLYQDNIEAAQLEAASSLLKYPLSLWCHDNATIGHQEDIASPFENVSPTVVACGQSIEGRDVIDSHLFAGDELGWIYVWNIETYCLSGPEPAQPRKLYKWRTHVSSVVSLEVVSSTRTLITASVDCCVRLWTWQGSFVGTFGQPSLWNMIDLTTFQHSMGPFDVLVDSETVALPEIQEMIKDVKVEEIDPEASRKPMFDMIDERSTNLFGDHSSLGGEIKDQIRTILSEPERLLHGVENQWCDRQLPTSKKPEGHGRYFHRLALYQLNEEIAIKKPVSYTDQSQMMEDVYAAHLDEPLPSATISFEERIRNLT